MSTSTSIAPLAMQKLVAFYQSVPLSLLLLFAVIFTLGTLALVGVSITHEPDKANA